MLVVGLLGTLTITDEPVGIKLGPSGLCGTKRMSLVTYSCTCGYVFKEYEDNYEGAFIIW